MRRASNFVVLIFITVLFAIFTANAQSIQINANPLTTQKTEVIWVNLNGFVGITTIRVTNVTSPNDTYKPHVVAVGQTRFPLSVKILKQVNVFYVDAYINNNQLTAAQNPNRQIQIDVYDDPNDDGDPPVVPAQNPGQGNNPGQGGNGNGGGNGNVGNGGGAAVATQIAVVKRQTEETLSDNNLTLEVTSPKDWPSEAKAIKVRITNGENIYESHYPFQHNPDGKASDKQIIGVKLHSGRNLIVVTIVKDDNVTSVGNGYLLQLDPPFKCGIACGDAAPTARASIGFEQIGASSTEGRGSPFLDFYFSAPLSKKDNRFSLWSNVRFSSIPVQTIVGFGALSAFSTFLTADAGKTNELVQSFDFQIGLEKSLFGEGAFHNGFLPGRTSVYAIAAVGAINPLSSRKTAQIFVIPKDNRFFAEQFPDALIKDNKDNYLYSNIAFVSPERSRFYRQYFGGLRFKTRFFDQQKLLRTDLFPAIVDITAGQNEAITGKLLGMILRANGSIPLPLKDGVLSIFGTAQVRMGKGKKDSVPQPLFLELADTSKVKLSDATTYIVPFEKNPNSISNRDVFRIGIGVDLFRLFKPESKP